MNLRQPEHGNHARKWTMKNAIPILILIMFISFPFLYGCSSKMDSQQVISNNTKLAKPSHNARGSPQGMPPGGVPRFNRTMNPLNDTMRQRFAEMEQAACNGKSEGEVCPPDSRTPEMRGICKTSDNKLLCTINRTRRQG